MTRWNGFGRSIAFGALAGLGFLATAPMLAALLGPPAATRLYLAGVAALYLLGVAPSRRAGLAAALAAGLGGGLLLWLPLGVGATALVLAIGVAALRSGALYRARALRAVVAELSLQVGGLALAGFLAAGSAASLALAIWGYFLVQAVFFLLAGVRARVPSGHADPFERARAELLVLLR